MWQTSKQIVPQTKEPFSTAVFLKLPHRPIIHLLEVHLLTPPTCLFFFLNRKAILLQIVILGNFLIFSLKEKKHQE